MNVLAGCEESGVVRRAFRGRGYNAYSCDLIEARDVSVWHYKCDVLSLLKEEYEWDLIILHPECTRIAVSGNRWWAGTPEREEAIRWTIALWEKAKKAANYVALENPVGLKIPGVTPQWIQPYEYGHPTTKKTGWWLHNLPHLVPTDKVKPTENRVWKMPPSATRARDRSVTPLGVADAMADQWGQYVLNRIHGAGHE